MTIDIANHQDHAPLDRKTLRALCRQVLRSHQREGDLSLCYVDNAAIRELNQRYLDRDEVTDVLAFPLEGGPGPDADRLLGEIVVSVEKAAAEAAARGVPAEAEIALYTAHGLLHLLGYDDHDPDETRAMRDAEHKALADAGLI